MIEYIFRPLDKWPREFTPDRKRHAPFHARKRVASSMPGGSDYTVRAELRAARIAAHPDKGGTTEDALRLEEAANLLAAHHKVAL